MPRDLNHQRPLIYLDDVIIFLATFEEHLKRMAHVLGCLEEHGLKRMPHECNLFRESKENLMHIVSREGVQPVYLKIWAIQEWLTPHSV